MRVLYRQAKNTNSRADLQQGFTLIEVIVVIVVLAVVAILGSKFVLQSGKAYSSVQTRSVLVSTGRQAVESMSRQLRVALSYSVRTTNSNTCLEFMPIVSGGNYFMPVADAINGVAASSSLTVSPHTVDFGSASFVSIGAAASTELYGVSPVSMATLASRTATSLTLTGAKTWQRNSLGQHFFLLDMPQAFCVVAGQLRFYGAQDATSSSVNTASTYSVLANNVSSSTPFALTAGSDNRNINVMFNITFVSGGESIALNQSVMIRNVP